MLRSPAIVGTSLGLVAGYNIFPAVIFDVYGSMYSLPSVKITYYVSYALIYCNRVAVHHRTLQPAAHSSLRENPVAMMRPKAPKMANVYFWNDVLRFGIALSFNSKITVSNLLRYKARNMMTILVCCRLYSPDSDRIWHQKSYSRIGGYTIQ